MTRIPLVLAGFGVAGLLVSLTACGTSTAGTGTAASVSSAAAQPGSPTSGASSSRASSSAPSASPTATATAIRTVKIAGTGTTGGSYQMSLWANDVISDCGAHSYGQQIIAYFAAHPCRTATRRLWTLPLNGRTVALSVVSVSAQIGKINENPDYQYAVQLAALENANGTGSVNDLLREGKRIPGVATAIPSNEVFSALAQDGLVVIMDAWYTTGTTSPTDAALKSLEADLTFSDATAPDA